MAAGGAGVAGPLPPVAEHHVIAETTCLRCGQAAPGPLRAAIWEEEEKGRLGAHPVSLCAACHEAFFAGAFSRVDLARWYHEARGTRPHGWIGRIDRDALLDGTCLRCGVLLPLGPENESARSVAALGAAMGAESTIECRSCHAMNRLRLRSGVLTSAEIVP
ncbi:MAG: hypothetical protein ACREOU_11455 [Candidatus Eiseniibacteriota bacterium]